MRVALRRAADTRDLHLKHGSTEMRCPAKTFRRGRETLSVTATATKNHSADQAKQCPFRP